METLRAFYFFFTLKKSITALVRKYFVCSRLTKKAILPYKKKHSVSYRIKIKKSYLYEVNPILRYLDAILNFYHVHCIWIERNILLSGEIQWSAIAYFSEKFSLLDRSRLQQMVFNLKAFHCLNAFECFSRTFWGQISFKSSKVVQHLCWFCMCWIAWFPLCFLL